MSFSFLLSYRNKLLSSVVFFLALAAAFSTCYFATPTVFGGRDQGAIATAAISFSKYKSFTFSNPVAHDLSQKYGAGRALNFPGFDYSKNGDLVSRFPKAYIIYLAIFYKIGGLRGIQYANLLPLFLFFVLFWLTLRNYFSAKISFLGFLLALTFFPFLWFAKYTLTEIFMLFWVWGGIYFLIRGLTLKSHKAESSLYVSFLFFSISALTRIEGLAFLVLAIIFTYLWQKKNGLVTAKKYWHYVGAGLLVFLVIYFLANFRDLLDSAKNFLKIFIPGSGKDSVPSSGLYGHLLVLFLNYNILPFIILGFAGILFLITKFKKFLSNQIFIPLAIIFPAFIYLVLPNISLDDPWIFRRYVFAVFPALLIYSLYALHKFFYHRIFFYIVVLALVLGNSLVSWRFLALSENKGLLTQVEKISQSFGPNDLILVDRLASGSGFSLLSDPLSAIYGKNAIYFFNSEDLKYVDKNRYKNIFLIAPLGQENAWYEEFIQSNPVGFQIIDNNFVEPSDKKFALAQNIIAQTPVGIWKLK